MEPDFNLTPEKYIQACIDILFPEKSMQDAYSPMIGAMKGGFFKGVEYERKRTKVSSFTVDGKTPIEG